MHIGLVIYGSLDTLSGGYLYDRMLVQHLRAEGNTVRLFSLPWRNYSRHLADNLNHRFFQQLADEPLDLLLQDELNHPSLALLNRRLRSRIRCPIVSIVHHLRCNERFPPVLVPLYRTIEAQYLRTVNAFIFNSRTTCSAVTALIGRQLRGLVAYPAADHLHPPSTERISELLAQRSTPGGSPLGALRILFVGNLIERKGLHTLLQAVARLPTSSWRLDVIGDLAVAPPYVRRIQTLIRRMGIGSSVELHGAVDEARLRAAYEQSHVLAVPSYEGFGIVYLEAMSYGLPVIASSAGAASEIVSHGVNGFLVGPADAVALAAHLHTLSGNPQQLHAMGISARHRYDSHPTWQKTFSAASSWLHEISTSVGGRHERSR